MWGCPPPDTTGCAARKQYAARYAVGCHLLSSDFHFPPRYTLLSLQHCDAFSTRKEHHDQSTDSRSGGRPPAHSEKRSAHHHRTLVANIVATARLAKVFALPIVLSTVNVKPGRSAP